MLQAWEVDTCQDVRVTTKNVSFAIYHSRPELIVSNSEDKECLVLL